MVAAHLPPDQSEGGRSLHEAQGEVGILYHTHSTQEAHQFTPVGPTYTTLCFSFTILQGVRQGTVIKKHTNNQNYAYQLASNRVENIVLTFQSEPAYVMQPLNILDSVGCDENCYMCIYLPCG